MPRKFFKQISPNPERLQKYDTLRWATRFVHDTQLWGFNRSSVAKGCAVGVFCCMLPTPLQMLLAAALAFFWRANLPLSVGLVWISNPLTMAPMFYANYKFGAWMLNSPSLSLKFEWSAQWFVSQLHLLWKPLFAGSFISGIVFALLAYYLVHLIWSWRVKRNWVKRKL